MIQKTFVLRRGVTSGAAPVGMFGQQGHPRKGFAARGARIFFHVGMGLQMRSKVGSVRKRPTAVLTGKRFFSRVSPYVALEKPRPGKSFPANGTLAR